MCCYFAVAQIQARLGQAKNIWPLQSIKSLLWFSIFFLPWMYLNIGLRVSKFMLHRGFATKFNWMEFWVGENPDGTQNSATISCGSNERNLFKCDGFTIFYFDTLLLVKHAAG